jgi:hypothetical protein
MDRRWEGTDGSVTSAPGREEALSEEALMAAARLQYAHHYWDVVPSRTP